MTETSPEAGANPLRRVGAMIYDAFLVAAIVLIITFIFVAIAHGAITEASLTVLMAYRVALVAGVVGYFGSAWTTKGQTLGMKVWGIVLVRMDGSKVLWRDVPIRLLLAGCCWLWVFGLTAFSSKESIRTAALTPPVEYTLIAVFLLNYGAAWLDSQRRSLHDRFLKTRIVRRPNK